MGRRIYLAIAPDAKKDEDGRDQFSSRSQFVLCAMGGAVGLGNLLRFPSVAFNNYGLQFFIPYFLGLFFVGIPILIMQICVGQAFRAGCVGAWNHVYHRGRGVGLSEVFNGFSVITYYVAILAWAMKYFRLSFRPLPWRGEDTRTFFEEEVVQFKAGTPDSDGNISYSPSGMIGETVGWVAFTWFIIWGCMYKGVGLTGRAIYATFAAPLVLIFILMVRALSLPNSSDGYRLFLGVWRTEALNGPQVWQDSFGQMFFSIGVGFGYFTTFASYNSKHANAVQDAFIIALTNCAIELMCAMACFGIVGYLGIEPEPGFRLGTFSSGFYYYPEALARMPGSSFFSVLFFATVWLLGLTCGFALIEVMITMVCDTTWGGKFPRWIVASCCCMGAFLVSLIYCSDFGYFALDSVDTFVNDLALFSTIWAELIFATTLYRWRDPVDQLGYLSWALYQGGYFFGCVLGYIVGHTVSPNAGAGVGFGLFIAGTIGSVLLGKTPTVPAPSFWAKNPMLSKLWYAAFYSGNQLRRDLNRAIMTGKNWRLHWFWPVCLKYITAPAVGMVLTFVYPKFIDTPDYNKDPIYIYGFALMHVPLVLIISWAAFPRFANFLIPELRRGEGKFEVAPQVTIGQTLVISSHGLEDGQPVNRTDGNNDLVSSEDNTAATKQTTVGGEKVL